MFKSFKVQPTKPGYYLWKNYNSLFKNGVGHNVFYLFPCSYAQVMGRETRIHITDIFFTGDWLGPYEFNFIKRMIKNPEVQFAINKFNQALLKP